MALAIRKEGKRGGLQGLKKEENWEREEGRGKERQKRQKKGIRGWKKNDFSMISI